MSVKHFVFCKVYHLPKHTPFKTVRKAKNSIGIFPQNMAGICEQGSISINKYSNLQNR